MLSIVHSLLHCHVPYTMILPCRKMYNVSLLKREVHLESHSCPMDSSEPDTRWGKMCVLCAFSGSRGKSRRASCVDCIVFLLGRRMRMPCFTAFMLTRGMFVCIMFVFELGSVKKWPVAPTSARIIFLLFVLVVS